MMPSPIFTPLEQTPAEGGEALRRGKLVIELTYVEWKIRKLEILERKPGWTDQHVREARGILD